MKFAVTLLPFSDTVQVGCEPHELTPVPVQVLKPKPFPGDAVSVTCGFPVKLAEQVPGQFMPAGLLVTVPVEVPANWTESWKVVAGAEETPA